MYIYTHYTIHTHMYIHTHTHTCLAELHVLVVGLDGLGRGRDERVDVQIFLRGWMA
jgi:hypothetical protein